MTEQLNPYKCKHGCERDELMNKLDAALTSIQKAYGYLWHVNNGVDLPVSESLRIPSLTPEKASYEARKALRDFLTHEQRGEGINAVREWVITQSGASTPSETAKYQKAVSEDAAIPQSSIDRMAHDFPILSAFHEKHGMPMMTQASCFKCGHIGERAITHAELPNMYICKDCAAPIAVTAVPEHPFKRGSAFMVDMDSMLRMAESHFDKRIETHKVRDMILRYAAAPKVPKTQLGNLDKPQNSLSNDGKAE